jgi:hypothetical protein
MLRKVLPLIVLCALASGPLFAEEAGKSSDDSATPQQGWGFKLGYLRGDKIGRQRLGYDTTQNGSPFFVKASDQPTLKNSPTVGAFYYYDLTPKTRFEAHLSVAPTKVEHVCPGVEVSNSLPDCGHSETTVTTTLIYWDVLFMPHFDYGRFHLGVPLSVGWANARASKHYAENGWVQGQSSSTNFTASGGMTYGLGLRPYWDLGGRKTAFFEVRALRFHRLVNTTARTAKTIEATMGMTFALGGKK